MIQIQKDLYQFSTHIPIIDLSFNQYLWMGEEPLLVHTGSHDQALAIMPEVEKVLGGKSLRYIFISHFEGDECGGLAHVLENYPNAQVVCSAITARQFDSFGIKCKSLIQKPGEILKTADYELEFISYPSEMHLWEGLLVFERLRGILFSSDLFLRFGSNSEPLRVNFKDEIQSITEQQIPDPKGRMSLQESLQKLPLHLVATGHGPYLESI